MSSDEEVRLTVPEKKNKIVTYTKYPDRTWERAKYLVLNTDRKLKDIAKELIMVESTLIARAYKLGWMSKRDKNDIVTAEENLERVIKEIAYQINDLNEHAGAKMEALQYSHRIKIIRDEEGRLHYRNFNDWPDKPPKDLWDKMSADDKQSHLMYIRPARYRAFSEELEAIFKLRQETLNFSAKMTKGSLPKIDAGVLDMSRRDTDDVIFDEGSIFSDNTAVVSGAPTSTPLVNSMIKQAEEEET